MEHWFERRDGSPLLIIDLEATCWGSRHTPDGAAQSIHNMEIIEIGCALANRQGGDSGYPIVSGKANPESCAE